MSINIKKYWWLVILALLELPILLFFAVPSLIASVSFFFSKQEGFMCDYPGACPSITSFTLSLIWLISTVATYALSIRRKKWAIIANIALLAIVLLPLLITIVKVFLM